MAAFAEVRELGVVDRLLDPAPTTTACMGLVGRDADPKSGVGTDLGSITLDGPFAGIGDDDAWNIARILARILAASRGALDRQSAA